MTALRPPNPPIRPPDPPRWESPPTPIPARAGRKGPTQVEIVRPFWAGWAFGMGLIAAVASLGVIAAVLMAVLAFAGLLAGSGS